MKLALFLMVLQCMALATSLSPCFVSFAGLASTDEKAVSLMTTTYEALLDLPKSAEARGRFYEAIERAADPFAVPSGENDLYVVGQKLNELREMARQLGWETPAMRGRLLEAVQRRRAGVAGVNEKADAAVKETRSDFTSSFPSADRSVPVPGGRYFVGQSHDRYPGTGDYVFIYDTKTDTTHTIPGYRVGIEHLPVINSDGTKAVIIHGRTLRVHAIKEGKLETPAYDVAPLKRWEKVLTSRANIALYDVTPMPNPNWIVAQISGEDKLVLYDLQKRTMHTIRGTGNFMPGFKPEMRNSWGVVQGKNSIVRLSRTKQGSELLVGDFNDKGQIPKWTLVAKYGLDGAGAFRDFYGPIPASSDYVVLRNHPYAGVLNVISLKDGTHRDFALLHPEGTHVQMKMHPNGKEMLTTTYVGNSSSYRMHWVDLERGKVTPFDNLSFLADINLSSDGESLLINHGDRIKTVNYRMRLVP